MGLVIPTEFRRAPAALQRTSRALGRSTSLLVLDMATGRAERTVTRASSPALDSEMELRSAGPGPQAWSGNRASLLLLGKSQEACGCE